MPGPQTLPDAPAPGGLVVSRRLFAGRYRLNSLLGSGAAQIWAAEDELLRRPVAVQEVRLPTALAPERRETLRQRVLLEAATARRLHASGLVPVFDVVSEGGTPAIVSELMAGGSLADALSLRGPLPTDVVARLGYYLSIPLEAAHRAGLHHGLVTPEHVLLGKDRTVRLTGFGTGPLSDLAAGYRGIVPAPERIRGGPRSAAGDVWGLGATLFTAVEGGPPYGRIGPMNGLAVLAAVQENRRRPFLRAGPLTALVSDLLAPRPADRPTLRDVREGLRPYLETTGEPTGGRHARRGSRLGRRRR